MEKVFKPYDKEFMRMAMLKHEETFKEQVYELHRLYRIQKILMAGNIDSDRLNTKSGKVWNLSNADTQRNSTKKIEAKEAESNCGRGLEIIDESEIELTLGPSIFNRRKKVETPLNSDSGKSFSSSSTGSSHINRTHSNELRLP